MRHSNRNDTITDTKQESIQETLVNNLQSLTRDPQQTAEKLVDALFEANSFLQEFNSNLAAIFKENKEIPKKMLEILCNKAVPYRQEMPTSFLRRKPRLLSVYHSPTLDSSKQSHQVKCFELIKIFIEFMDTQTEITLPLEFYLRTTVDFVNKESASLSSMESESHSEITIANHFQYLSHSPVQLFIACQQLLIHPVTKRDEQSKTILHHLLASDQSTTHPEQFLQTLAIFLTHITDEYLFKIINLSDRNNKTPFQIAMQKYTECLQGNADGKFIDGFEKIFVDIIEKILRNDNVVIDRVGSEFILKILYRQAINDTSTQLLEHRKKCSELASSFIRKTDYQAPPESHGKTSTYFKYLTQDPLRLFIALRAKWIQPVEKQDSKRRTVLHHLLENSDTPEQFAKSLRMLAENITEEELTSILGSQDKNGETCLCRAVRKKKISQAYILLDTGAIPTLATTTQIPQSEPEIKLFNYMQYQLTRHHCGKETDELVANFLQVWLNNQSHQAIDSKQDESSSEQYYLSFLTDGGGLRYIQTYGQFMNLIKKITKEIPNESTRPAISPKGFQQTKQAANRADYSLFSYRALPTRGGDQKVEAVEQTTPKPS